MLIILQGNPDLSLLHQFIGQDAETILWWQMIIRAVLIFFIALIMVRIGGKRIFGKHTAFDIVLGIVLGSILGRVITGNAPFLTSIVAGFTLVFLHWLIAFISFKWHPFGKLVKGNYQLLVKNGEIQWENMKRHHISERDLHEAIRMHGNGSDIDRIESAYYERSGEISIQLKRED